jgi:LacI family transcriptional regulator
VTTIGDVASHACVSIKTVSRVLNNEPHVRVELKNRVLQAITILNYRPSQAARRMGGNRSYLIVFPTWVGEAYLGRLVAGAAKRCSEINHHLVVESVPSIGEDIGIAVERVVASLSPDGIILPPALCDDLDLIAAINSLGVRVVRISSDKRHEGLNVFTDDRAAGRIVTEHLIALGHKRIAMISGYLHHYGAGQRFAGYQDAMNAAGLEIAPGMVMPEGDFDIASGLAAGQALMNLPVLPTAIFAANDEMAFGVMLAAQSLGIKIPSQISLAGFDDAAMSRVLQPALTTIRQSIEDMGRAAVDLIVDRDTVQRDVEIASELVTRTSTRKPAVAKPRRKLATAKT